ncbi:MAG: hypothetical protein PWQ25_1743 [Deferribacteres bacterium]|nr:hypothetical protein [Deferribacteres bacterium]
MEEFILADFNNLNENKIEGTQKKEEKENIINEILSQNIVDLDLLKMIPEQDLLYSKKRIMHNIDNREGVRTYFFEFIIKWQPVRFVRITTVGLNDEVLLDMVYKKEYFETSLNQVLLKLREKDILKN